MKWVEKNINADKVQHLSQSASQYGNITVQRHRHLTHELQLPWVQFCTIGTSRIWFMLRRIKREQTVDVFIKVRKFAFSHKSLKLHLFNCMKDSPHLNLLSSRLAASGNPIKTKPTSSRLRTAAVLLRPITWLNLDIVHTTCITGPIQEHETWRWPAASRYEGGEWAAGQ